MLKIYKGDIDAWTDVLDLGTDVLDLASWGSWFEAVEGDTAATPPSSEKRDADVDDNDHQSQIPIKIRIRQHTLAGGDGVLELASAPTHVGFGWKPVWVLFE